MIADPHITCRIERELNAIMKKRYTPTLSLKISCSEADCTSITEADVNKVFAVFGEILTLNGEGGKWKITYRELASAYFA
jgi:hypothetical protein